VAKKTKELEGSVPHMAIITVRGVVNRQLPNGLWSPIATFNDGFNFQIEGPTEQEVIKLLRENLNKMKESCQKGK